jgi:hypothetical protein
MLIVEVVPRRMYLLERHHHTLILSSRYVIESAVLWRV